MDIQDDDFIRFWRTLNGASVKYLMVGGFAVNIHGFNRTTGDIDLWIEDTNENRKNLGKALEELRIAPAEIVLRMQFIPGWTQMTLPNGFPLDIMTGLKGLEELTFDECLSLAVWAEIEDIRVPFLHLNQLMAAKEAANRPKDQIDLEELRRIQQIQKKIDGK
jgi:predicted nucleotidyltransferase